MCTFCPFLVLCPAVGLCMKVKDVKAGGKGLSETTGQPMLQYVSADGVAAPPGQIVTVVHQADMQRS